MNWSFFILIEILLAYDTIFLKIGFHFVKIEKETNLEIDKGDSILEILNGSFFPISTNVFFF